MRVLFDKKEMTTMYIRHEIQLSQKDGRNIEGNLPV